MTTASYQRRVSPNEWLYLVGERIAPPAAIHLCIEGDGRCDAEILRGALAAISLKCPGAALERQGNTWRSSGRIPEVSEYDLEVDGNLDSSAENGFAALVAHPALQQSMPRHEGEIIIFRAQKTIIVFRVPHAIMDAQGVILWARQVLAVARGESVESLTDAMSDVEAFRLLGGKEAPPIASDARSPFSQEMFSRREKVATRRITLPGEHGALVAKIAKLIAEHSEHPDSTVMVPVDLRRHGIGEHSTANLSLPLFLRIRGEQSWQSVQWEILAALQRKDELNQYPVFGSPSVPLWVGELGVRLVDWICRLRQRYFASAIVSHLGAIDLQKMGIGDFCPRTAFSLPVYSPLIPLAVTALECGSRTEMLLSCAGGDEQVAALDLLAKKISQFLLCGEIQAQSMGSEFLEPTANEFREHRSVFQLISAAANRFPDHLAIASDVFSMTYAELMRQIDLVACELKARGVRQGDVVGVEVDRDPRTLVLLLSVLRLNGTYLPIDPQQPMERQAFLLGDAAANLFVASTVAHAEDLASRVSVNAVARDALFSFVAGEELEAYSADHADLLYIMFTSGSTGVPKGVRIDYQNMINYLLWARDYYGISPSSRFVLLSSLAFDLSVTAWLLPLIAGGCVEVLLEPLTGLSMHKILQDGRVNSLKITPAHLAMIDHLPPLARSAISLVVVGGDQFSLAAAERAQKYFGTNCRIVNEYGPTEATVGCIVHQYDSAVDYQGAAVPIGLPITGAEIILMKKEESQDGVGEIFVGGRCLSPGYVNASSEQKNSFLELADGRRVYRTGDLARVNQSGDFEYLGRAQEQLKVNGFRIDTEEIRRAMLATPSIQDAYIAIEENHDARKRQIVAYLVAKESVTFTTLQQSLASRLAPYMMPHQFALVSELPVNPNGKVDRQLLREKVHIRLRPELGEAVLAGREGEIAAIWAAVLGLECNELTPTSNFYSLGGDSISMLEMLDAVRTQFAPNHDGLTLLRSMEGVVAEPTIKRLANLVSTL
jgi:amino acid adenylation domain-containing protein